MSSRAAHRHRPRLSGRPINRSHVGVTVLALAITVLTGCMTERVVTSDGRPLPEPARPAPPVPDSARVNRMALMVGSKPEDANGNGYPDLIRATVALFAHPHPTAVRAAGDFQFTLWDRGDAGRENAEPIARWRIEPGDSRRLEANAIYGPAYLFQLNLAATGRERLPLGSADLRCEFIPADGSTPVHSDGVRSIQIGRRAAVE